MNHHGCLGRVCGLAAGWVALIVWIEATHGAGESPAPVAPAAFLTTLGFKFDGSPSCSSEKCHGAEKSVNKKNFWGNEFTLWHGRKDPHHTAFRTLVKPKAKEIAAAMKIPSAIKSERCLNCHSTLAVGPAGQDLKGKEYTAAEGVSCNSCHGPSQKYLEPHSKEGWIDTQRPQGHAALLTGIGLYDTLPVFARATRCTSCHLMIEPDLVAAGHPQPTFEMNHFSMIYPDRHWHDPAGLFPAQLWASGQLAEVRDAMLQIGFHAASKSAGAPEELRKAYNQAMAHVAVFYELTTVKAIDIAALNAQVQALAAANKAKDVAAIGASANAVAEQCQAEPLVKAISEFNPDAATATKLLGSIAKSDIGKTYGPRGQEQQAYAIEALAAAIGNDAIKQAVAPMLPIKPGEPPKWEDYEMALTALRAKLP